MIYQQQGLRVESVECALIRGVLQWVICAGSSSLGTSNDHFFLSPHNFKSILETQHSSTNILAPVGAFDSQC